MSARPGKSFLALFLEALAEADDALKRELAAYLRPYLADGPDRLLDASEKARQLGLQPRDARKNGARRSLQRRHQGGAGVAVPPRQP
jgi:hypothetical protein